MTSSLRNSLIMMLICTTISALWGIAAGRSAPGGSLDFQGVYYGARCLLQHCDPYNENQLETVYRLTGGESPKETIQHRRTVTLFVNLPSTILFVTPLALLPWGPAQFVWNALTIGGVFCATFIVWKIGAEKSCAMSSLLACLLLLNCEVLFGTANTAGIVISLCVLSVFCFMQNRYVPLGILCLGISMAIKPHDVGLVWLYFVLAGGVARKHAIKALAVTATMAGASVVWISIVAPQWLAEMNVNLAQISGASGLNSPGPNSLTGHTAAMVIDLQAALSVFLNDARFYNTTSYLVCGLLLSLWCLKTVNSPASKETEWIALAAVAPLTMLLTYHRPYDAKLLLVAIPACATLWATGSTTGRLAGVITMAGIALTGDIPLAILQEIYKCEFLKDNNWMGRWVQVVLTRPASLALLAMAVFYLSVYIRMTRSNQNAIVTNVTSERVT